MRRISIPRPIETIEIEIGDTVITVQVEITNASRLRFGKLFLSVSDRLSGHQKLYDDALERKDFAALARQADAMVGIVEPAMKELIGEEDYGKVIAACGCGERMSKGACLEVFTPLMHAVTEILAEHDAANAANSEKIAHHQAEVPDALQSSDID